MPSLNQVTLVGNLTRDPEVRYIPDGTAVGDFGIAINETYKTKGGESKETVTFVDIVVWGRTAENAKEYLAKGSAVLVVGRLQLDQWETKEGEKKSKMRVRADRLQFLTFRDQGKDRPTDAPPRSSRPAREEAPEDHNRRTDGAEEDIPF
jgi:single-strand DNA-binding protein